MEILTFLGLVSRAPDLEENGKGLGVFEKFGARMKISKHFTSYVISDYRRKITFGIHAEQAEDKRRTLCLLLEWTQTQRTNSLRVKQRDS